jgi:hypothetical protein
MNEKITNEKQNIEKIYQEQLKENAEQVFVFFYNTTKNFYRFLG